MSDIILYIIVFFITLILSSLFTPLYRALAIKLNILDRPITSVKTHKEPVPYLGGLAILSSWIISLFIVRIFTHFPTGTLNNIRAVMFGSLLFAILGLCDDIKKGGLNFKIKFLIQILSCIIVVVLFDIRIYFISNYFFSVLVSIVWIIGISNAFNILDIMDGLASSIAIVASLFFLFIALPSEMIYVNFCAIALLGACLGFLPYNLSKKKKIFMGDTGSLFIGFILATISMGTSYTKINEIGVFAPLFILAIPIYETLFVMFIRIKHGKNPFLGSKDHFPLRLEKLGLTRKQILISVIWFAILFGILAYIIVNTSYFISIMIFIFVVLSAVLFSVKISKVKVD